MVLQGWFVSAGLIYAFIPGLNFLSSLAVAACLTPTDPILAAAVVGGKWADKHVPAHIRHLLAAESGCNDGAAYPFLFISLYLILDKNTGHAIRDWFLLLWLCESPLNLSAFGVLMGCRSGHLGHCHWWTLGICLPPSYEVLRTSRSHRSSLLRRSIPFTCDVDDRRLFHPRIR